MNHSRFQDQVSLMAYFSDTFPSESVIINNLWPRFGIQSVVRHLVEFAYVQKIDDDVLRDHYTFFVSHGGTMVKDHVTRGVPL